MQATKLHNLWMAEPEQTHQGPATLKLPSQKCSAVSGLQDPLAQSATSAVGLPEQFRRVPGCQAVGNCCDATQERHSPSWYICAASGGRTAQLTWKGLSETASNGLRGPAPGAALPERVTEGDGCPALPESLLDPSNSKPRAGRRCVCRGPGCCEKPCRVQTRGNGWACAAPSSKLTLKGFGKGPEAKPELHSGNRSCRLAACPWASPGSISRQHLQAEQLEGAQLT